MNWWSCDCDRVSLPQSQSTYVYTRVVLSPIQIYCGRELWEDSGPGLREIEERVLMTMSLSSSHLAWQSISPVVTPTSLVGQDQDRKSKLTETWTWYIFYEISFRGGAEYMSDQRFSFPGKMSWNLLTPTRAFPILSYCLLALYTIPYMYIHRYLERKYIHCNTYEHITYIHTYRQY
jgi:hypothetical protein